MSDIQRRIEATENVVREAWGPSLADHISLVERMVELCGGVVSDFEPKSTLPVAASVVARHCVRLANDLRATTLLARDGYVEQTLALVASMCEIAHVAGYIGGNSERAERWFQHSAPDTPFVSVYDAILATVRDLGLDETRARHEYENEYRTFCMAKHGHPRALRTQGMSTTEDQVHMPIGPDLSARSLKAAQLGLWYGARYLWIAVGVLVRNHTPPTVRQQREQEAEAAFQELQRLDKRYVQQPARSQRRRNRNG